jgi:gluconolactonase
LPGDRIFRWSESGGIQVHRQPSGFENGHARDRQGRLIGCSHRHRCITRVELDGTLTVLADRYQGHRLNSPNDVVVKRDGSIWFTDPPYGIQTDYEGGKQVAELPARIYRLDPSTGELSIVSEAYQGPNGLCFSPDESLLYVSETGLQFSADPLTHIKVHGVSPDGRSVDDGRVFHRISPGNADGIRCDQAGHVWSSAGDGVHCISPDGRLLGKIMTPHLVSNLCFGGRNLSRLFICASHTLMAIYTNTRGAVSP